VLTASNAFEHELRKLISTEIDRLKDILAGGGAAIPDYASYLHHVGQIAALRKVEHAYCEEVENKLNEQR
jgi:hypothetical protein